MRRVHFGLASTCAVLSGVAALAWWLWSGVTVPPGPAFEHDVRPTPIVRQTLLSDYGPGLAGTPGDTPVYVLRGPERGGTALVLGGTHGNEIAGIVAAVVLVEHTRPARGTLIVVPHANNSSVTYADPVRPGPEWVTIEGAHGQRRFKYGARRTNPDHQGAADPQRYRHSAGSDALAGNEVRNLARAYPGDPDGPLTQRIAAAIVRMVVNEKVTLVIDLHENEPSARLAWAIVSHPRSVPLAEAARGRLRLEGLDVVVEDTSAMPRGTSPREIGDATSASTFLIETPNPGQVARREDIDQNAHPDLPLTRRVGAQLSAVRALLNAHNARAGTDARVVVHEIPTIAEVMNEGVGKYLR
jgi:predicted deacylase